MFWFSCMNTDDMISVITARFYYEAVQSKIDFTHL